MLRAKASLLLYVLDGNFKRIYEVFNAWLLKQNKGFCSKLLFFPWQKRLQLFKILSKRDLEPANRSGSWKFLRPGPVILIHRNKLRASFFFFFLTCSRTRMGSLTPTFLIHCIHDAAWALCSHYPFKKVFPSRTDSEQQFICSSFLYSMFFQKTSSQVEPVCQTKLRSFFSPHLETLHSLGPPLPLWFLWTSALLLQQRVGPQLTQLRTLLPEPSIPRDSLAKFVWTPL